MKFSCFLFVIFISSSDSFNAIPSISRAIKANILPQQGVDHLYPPTTQLNSVIETDNEIGDGIENERADFLPSLLMKVSSSDRGQCATDIEKSEIENERADFVPSLLMKVSSSDRGQCATDIEKSEIENIIQQIEENSAGDSTNNPTFSSSIQGTWELLYSNTQLFRSSPFFMAGRDVCQTEEQAKQYDWFCDMHRAALAISTIGKVRQIITETRMISEFEVKVGAVPFLNDITPFSYSGGLPVTIDGAIVSSADITPTSDGGGWEIFMDAVEIKGSNIPLLRTILDNGLKLESRELASFLEDNVSGYTTPRPVFKTTYLDDTIRISRDPDGKVFVYGKVSNSVFATDYSGTDPDLGLTQLWEGFKNSILS